jgi:Holliday junction resolvase
VKESVIQRQILTWLKANGYYAVKTISTNRNGTPDILTCVNGRFVGIEVKTEIGKTSKLQDYQIKAIIESGGHAFVARSLDDVKNVLNVLT